MPPGGGGDGLAAGRATGAGGGGECAAQAAAAFGVAMTALVDGLPQERRVDGEHVAGWTTSRHAQRLGASVRR